MWPVGAMLGSVLSVPFPGIVLVHTILRVGVLHKHVSLPPFCPFLSVMVPLGQLLNQERLCNKYSPRS